MSGTVPRYLLHGSFVTYGKDPLSRLNAFSPDLLLEPVGHLLGDKDMLPLFAAFSVPYG